MGDQTQEVSASPGGPARADRARRSHTATIVVLVVGVIATTALAIGARQAHDANERTLLRQRVREAATVAGGAVATLSSQLGGPVATAEVTAGDPATFRRLVAPETGPKGSFQSASLWSTRNGFRAPVVVVGTTPELQRLPSADRVAYLTRVAGSTSLTIEDLLSARRRRLGYGIATGPGATYVAYAERDLPKDRRATVDRTSAFASLDYAIYLGTAARPSHLLASSIEGAGGTGRQARARVPFGDRQLLLVGQARGEMGGSLPAQLPWLLAAAGALLVLGAAALVERITRGRRGAQDLATRLGALAAENEALFEEQRRIASTLQHSLLPTALPVIPGLQSEARYLPGAAGTEVGGDWYDVLPLSPDRLLFSVGDVSGHGLAAAAMMASLRFAVRAYALEGGGPAVILDKLARLADVGRDQRFATVLCGLIDTSARTLTVASAGHPSLLLLDDAGAHFLDVGVGVPIGVESDDHYRATTVDLDAAGTVIGYTDGLVERRGEVLDVGLDRLQAEAGRTDAPLAELVTRIVEGLGTETGGDDVAVLAIRWEFGLTRVMAS